MTKPRNKRAQVYQLRLQAAWRNRHPRVEADTEDTAPAASMALHLPSRRATGATTKGNEMSKTVASGGIAKELWNAMNSPVCRFLNEISMCDSQCEVADILAGAHDLLRGLPRAQREEVLRHVNEMIEEKPEV